MSDVNNPMTSMNSPDLAALKAMIDQLTAENARLKSNKASSGSGLKVSAKGALSFYGLGRFPVTLYKSQWRKLLSNTEAIVKFLDENDAVLASREEA